MTASDPGTAAPAGPGLRIIAEALSVLEALRQTAGEHPGPECQACPFCQTLAALRQVRPEAVEHLAAAGAELAAALRELTSPAARPPGSERPERPERPEASGPPERSERPAGAWAPSRLPEPVQRIEIGD